MRSVLAPLLASALLLASSRPALAQTSGAGSPARTIAVTVDDLPLAGPHPDGARCDADYARSLTDRLVGALVQEGVPAIGFVNESAPCPDVRDAVLRQWLDAGLELGNHTYGHVDINAVSVDSFGVHVERGERATRALLAEAGQTLRYFRHPYLHTGDTPEKRAALDSLLAARGYTVAPVTVDSDEWMWAHAYAAALARGDTAIQARLRTEYLDWIEGVTAHFEARSVAVVGREIPQILLIHANALAADTAAELARRLRARGYRFVSLSDALADPAYRRPDPYVGPRGISWLHRWADEIVWEPDAPDWVDAYRRRDG